MEDKQFNLDEALVEQQLRFCKQVLIKLKKNPNAFPFLEPVDPVKLGIPDYPLKIKNPMDISTIKKKLDNKAYKSSDEFHQDVKLMFNNCYVYNNPDSDVYKMGKNVEAAYDDAMLMIPQEIAKKKKKSAIVVPTRSKQPKRNVRSGEAMNVEDYEFCSDVLNELCRPKHKAYNWPFLEPVDGTLVPMYYDVIKFPMDLRTMREKLSQNAYQTVEEFISDLRLIIDNCYNFNEAGTDVYNCATELNNAINALVSKYEPKDIKGRIIELKKKIVAYTKEIKNLEAKLVEKNDGSVPAIKSYSLNERIDLGNRILNLNKTQTESVARIIQKHSAGEYVENNEIEVDLRMLPDNVFEEIDSYISKIEIGIGDMKNEENVI